jgi:hypothetical protein
MWEIFDCFVRTGMNLGIHPALPSLQYPEVIDKERCQTDAIA